jgi:hypothetical protein
MLQARRAEAQQLFALGQVEDEAHPTLAFAYAIAALERADTEEIRRFALRQLWKGPLAFVATDGSNGGVSSLVFSPDGEWLADAGLTTRVWRRDGSGPQNVGRPFVGSATAHFVGNGRTLVLFGRRSSGGVGADVLALSNLSQLEQIETPGEVLLAMHGDQLTTLMPRAPKGSGADIFIRSFGGTRAQRLGFLRDGGRFQIGASGDTYLISYPRDRQLFASTLRRATAGQRSVLSASAPIASFWLARSGERVALVDDRGEMYVAVLTEPGEPRHIAGPPVRRGIGLRHAGAALLAACDSWRPGHADGLGSLRHAHRDRQPGGNRAGRSHVGRRAAPPDWS